MNKILVLLILLAGICFGTCKKDECADRIDQKLDSFAIAAVPYETGQIISFKTSIPNVINASVTRISKILKPDAPYACEGYLEINLKDSNSNKLRIDILMRGSTKSNLIQITIFHADISGPIVQFEVEENSELVHFSSDGESTFYDQLEIDGRAYSKVIKITYPNLQQDNGIKEFYYNAEFGILKIETNDNFTLSLM
jgi:hypothetical protein